ncbi:MAG: NADH-quinone oxidoreductase subunit J [Caldimicrobium sp.]
MFERGLILLCLLGLSLFLFFLTFIFRHILYQFLSILLIMLLIGISYLFLNAEFLAAVQIIVYAGAILIMFLFTLFLFPEEELNPYALTSKDIKTDIFLFLPLGLFLFLFLYSLFKSVPGIYTSQSITFDLKPLAETLYNNYWIVIYILGFLLSLPMIGLYIFLKKEDSIGDN